MGEFGHSALRDATPRQIQALQRMHPRLGAEPIKVGRWPFRRREWQVSCPDCNWTHPETIPVMPGEMKLAETWLLRVAMESHLVEELRTLTFAQVWLGRG